MTITTPAQAACRTAAEAIRATRKTVPTAAATNSARIAASMIDGIGLLLPRVGSCCLAATMAPDELLERFELLGTQDLRVHHAADELFDRATAQSIDDLPNGP